MKKIGLVIQGPLLSIGKSGEQFYWSLDELAATGGPVHYDCRDNIRKLIGESEHLFDEIVISTWENELKPGEKFEGAKIVTVPDPGGIKRSNNHHYKDNNKFRQFLSTLNGILELEKSGIDYAVKIRGDTYLDLEKLVGSFLAGKEKNDDPCTIYAPVIHPPTFLIHDLYFAAELPMLKKFCEAILSYDRFEFISSAHMEIVLKHAYSEYRDDIGVPDWAYFPLAPLIGVSEATRRVFDYMLKNVYRSLEGDIFLQLEWRGSRFPEKHVLELVEDRNLNRRPPRVPAFISQDWERYFNFRRMFMNRWVTMLDNLLVWTGKLGWRVWNKIRNIWKGK